MSRVMKAGWGVGAGVSTIYCVTSSLFMRGYRNACEARQLLVCAMLFLQRFERSITYWDVKDGSFAVGLLLRKEQWQ